MNGKITVLICVLTILGILLPGSVQSAGAEANTRGSQISSKANSPSYTQQQVTTSPPPQLEADETNKPIASEAGRDYGLIVGAVILIMIVVGGVIFGVRQKSAPKARD